MWERIANRGIMVAMTRPRGLSLRLKIFFGMAAAALLPLVVMAWQGHRFARDMFLGIQREHVIHTLEASHAKLVAWYATRDRGGDRGAGTAEATLGDELAARPALSREIASVVEPAECRIFQERIMLLDARGVLRYASPACAAVTGAPARLPEELRAAPVALPLASPPSSSSLLPPLPALRYWRDAAGTPLVGAAVADGRLGVTLVVATPADEPYHLLDRYRMHAALTALLTFVCVLLLASRGALWLARPFRTLGEVARRVAEGRHDVRVGPLRDPEAAELAEAFDRMLDEIEAAHARIVRSATLAAVGELSSSVVHEMRNPLSSVKINLQALRRRVDALGDALHRELAEIAIDQVNRLERMLTDLLHYGKPLALRVERLRFRELAEPALELMKPATAERGILFRVEDRLNDRRIAGDRELLLRALTNLLANAAQASPDGGTVALTGFAEGAALLLRVEDRGAGVRDADREGLFRPFFTTRSSGTGLGLANVKKIVERHGGSVAYEPVAEGGSRFTIRLREEGPPPEPAAPNPPEPSPSKEAVS